MCISDREKSAQSEAEENLKTLQNSSGGTLAQYQNLVKILQAYRDEDQKTATLLYVDTDLSLIHILLITGEYHADNPEEDDIITGYQHVRRIEIFQLFGLLRPAQGRKRPQGRGEDVYKRQGYGRGFEGPGTAGEGCSAFS